MFLNRKIKHHNTNTIFHYMFLNRVIKHYNTSTMSLQFFISCNKKTRLQHERDVFSNRVIMEMMSLFIE